MRQRTGPNAQPKKQQQHSPPASPGEGVREGDETPPLITARECKEHAQRQKLAVPAAHERAGEAADRFEMVLAQDGTLLRLAPQPPPAPALSSNRNTTEPSHAAAVFDALPIGDGRERAINDLQHAQAAQKCATQRQRSTHAAADAATLEVRWGDAIDVARAQYRGVGIGQQQYAAGWASAKKGVISHPPQGSNRGGGAGTLLKPSYKLLDEHRHYCASMRTAPICLACLGLKAGTDLIVILTRALSLSPPF